MNRSEFRERIKRDLGHPYIKVELSNDHIDDAIDDALHKMKEWGTGNAIEEVFYVLPLSAGQRFYDMPEGVIEVLDYDEQGGYTGGANELFTVQNYLYNMGYLNPSAWAQKGNLINYHLALGFLDTFKKYSVDKFNYRYHNLTNKVEITPIPEVTDNGKYVLLRTYALKGSTDPNWTEETLNEELYGKSWVRKYATALAKKKLGYIRRKFSNFQSVGNTGISLDGDSLISEANEEMDKLSEEFSMEYVYEGFGDIVTG